MLRALKKPWRINLPKGQVHRGGQPFIAHSQRILPHQLEGIQFGREVRGRLLLADGMGLGKTLQAVMIAATFPKDFPALVVTPASVVLNWQGEIRRWLPGRSVAVLRQKRQPLQRSHGFVVVSYDMLRMRQQELADYGFGIVICDESHFIKNPKAQRTKAALELLRQARRRVLLSGTPATKHAVDVFTQLHVLLPHRFPDYEEFGKTFSDSSVGNCFQGSNVKFAELLFELQKICIIRRTADITLSLPPLVLEKVSGIVMSSEEAYELLFWRELRLVHAGILGGLLKRLANLGKPTKRGGFYLGDKDKMARQIEFHQKRCRDLLLHAWHVSGLFKVSVVLDLVRKKLCDGNSQVIVFAHHTDVLDSLSKPLKEAGVAHVRMDGRTSAELRQRLIQRFQSGDVRVALLSMTAMAQGVNLTAATHAVMAEIPWTPALFQQAIGRMHRIGQECETRCILPLLGEPSIDEHMIHQLERKSEALADAGVMDPLRWDVHVSDKSCNSCVDEEVGRDLSGFRNFVRKYLRQALLHRRASNSEQCAKNASELEEHRYEQTAEQAVDDEGGEASPSTGQFGCKAISNVNKNQRVLQDIKTQWSLMSAAEKRAYSPKEHEGTQPLKGELEERGSTALGHTTGLQRRNLFTLPMTMDWHFAHIQELPLPRTKVLEFMLAERGVYPPTVFLS